MSRVWKQGRDSSVFETLGVFLWGSKSFSVKIILEEWRSHSEQ